MERVRYKSEAGGSQGSQNELTGMPWESTRSVMRWESAIV